MSVDHHTQLRDQARILGTALLIYWAILHIAALLAQHGGGWCYLLALAISFFCYTRWKTPGQFKEMLSHKEQSMTFGCFLGMLCLVIGAQVIAQLSDALVRMVAATLDIPMVNLVGQTSANVFEPAMFLYVCILGPVAEELLFRGVVLRTLATFGKKLAIFVSALLFGLFHGNLLQTPYAFVLGLVLGYAALEYRLIWAMLLHVGSNLIFAYGLPLLLEGLPPVTQTFCIWTVILVAAYAGVCLMLSKAGKIRTWLKENAILPGQLCCIFSTGTILSFTILMMLCIFAFLLT